MSERTAFAAALYFLEQYGHTLPESFPVNEVVDFCISVVEENMRFSRGESVQPRSIAEIATWFRELLTS